MSAGVAPLLTDSARPRIASHVAAGCAARDVEAGAAHVETPDDVLRVDPFRARGASRRA
jgi:hypothetical protein